MIIFTDGACSGNGKANNSGGFGVVVMDNYETYVIDAYSKRNNDTTNNREELKAILYTFLNYGVRPPVNGFSQVDIPTVYSDSAYCVNAFNTWMFSWANNGWVKSDKKIPENLDLIQAYYDWYQKGYRINLEKIKGHAGYLGNELADALASGRETVEEVLSKYGSY